MDTNRGTGSAASLYQELRVHATVNSDDNCENVTWFGHHTEQPATVTRGFGDVQLQQYRGTPPQACAADGGLPSMYFLVGCAFTQTWWYKTRCLLYSLISMEEDRALAKPSPSRWKQEMEDALASAQATQAAADKAVAALKRMSQDADRDLDYAKRSVSLALSNLIVHEASASADAVTRPLSAARRPRLAIAMLLKDPNLVALRTFIRYHTHLGFEGFTFFLDDTTSGVTTPECNAAAAHVLDCWARDEGDAARHTSVKVHRCSSEWWRRAEPQSVIWDQWASYLSSDVIARQVLAIELGAREALAEGFEWLLHIDVDEALTFGLGHAEAADGHADAAGGAGRAENECDRSGTGRGNGNTNGALAATRFFASLPAELDEVVFLNFEAAPEQLHVQDWFREVTLFRVNPSCGGAVDGFVAYSNGKGAVRLSDAVVPAGSHRFTSTPDGRKLQSMCATSSSLSGASPRLLHYVNCGLDEWRRKYVSLGPFGDSWLGRLKIPFPFHLASRNLIHSDASSAQAAEVYSKAMVHADDAATRAALATGELVRCSSVSQAIRLILSESESASTEMKAEGEMCSGSHCSRRNAS